MTSDSWISRAPAARAPQDFFYRVDIIHPEPQKCFFVFSPLFHNLGWILLFSTLPKKSDFPLQYLDGARARPKSARGFWSEILCFLCVWKVRSISRRLKPYICPWDRLSDFLTNPQMKIYNPRNMGKKRPRFTLKFWSKLRVNLGLFPSYFSCCRFSFAGLSDFDFAFWQNWYFKEYRKK